MKKQLKEMMWQKTLTDLENEASQDVSSFEIGTEKRKAKIRKLILTDSPLCDLALLYVDATKKQRKIINKTTRALCGCSMPEILAVLNDGNENRRELRSW